MDESIEKIEARVAALGLTMKFVCDRVGMPLSTWSRWKAGKQSPRKGSLTAILTEVDDLERRLAK